MLMIAIVFFAVAIALGLFLLSYVLGNKKAPTRVALIHGSVAAIGLILLISYAFQNTSPSMLMWSIGIFIMAAIGGITLVTLDVKGKPVPKAMAIGHGLAALVAFTLLLMVVFR